MKVYVFIVDLYRPYLCLFLGTAEHCRNDIMFATRREQPIKYVYMALVHILCTASVYIACADRAKIKTRGFDKTARNKFSEISKRCSKCQTSATYNII